MALSRPTPSPPFAQLSNIAIAVKEEVPVNIPLDLIQALRSQPSLLSRVMGVPRL